MTTQTIVSLVTILISIFTVSIALFYASKNGVKASFENVADVINGSERGILDLLSALVPYAVPVVPAYLTYFHTRDMMALVKGLQYLPPGWEGTICSDSMITLGRAFDGWKCKNLPRWLISRLEFEKNRLVNWKNIKHILHAGHPTKAQLEAGVGRHGLPVSKWNVWCDKHCALAYEEYKVKNEI